METDSQEKTVGEIIGKARQKSGLSLRELAGRMSVHFTYLADIEKNRRPATEKIIKSLSEQKELDLDFDFLMSLSGRLGEDVEKYHKKHALFGDLLKMYAVGFDSLASACKYARQSSPLTPASFRTASTASEP